MPQRDMIIGSHKNIREMGNTFMSADQLRQDARSAVARNDIPKALELYQKLLKVEPDDASTWVTVGDLCRSAGHADAAIRFYANGARKYAAGGELLKAISVNKRILDLAPNHKETQKALASLYALRKQDEASHADDAIEMPPPQRTSPDDGVVLDPDAQTVDLSGGIELDDSVSGGAAPFEEPDITPAAPVATSGDDEDDLFGDTLNLAQDGLSDLEDLVGTLPQVPIFSEVGPDAFAAIIDELFSAQFGAGDLVLQEGDPGESFYVICEGQARVVKRTPDCGTVELAILGPGDFFGEFAFLTDTPRTASIVAQTDLTLLEFERNALENLTHRYPGIRRTLEKFYLRRLVGAALRISPIFRDLDRAHIGKLIRAFEPGTIDAGSVLIEQDAPTPALFLIVSGEVEVSRDDQPQPLAVASAGDVIGEIGLLTGKPATATCRACTDLRVYQLAAERFDEVLEPFPTVRERLQELAKARLGELQALKTAPEPAELAEEGLV
ncbi:MAG: hypothetical protein D6761_09080 [Candidatus Dadabacteria bacterium]|nr:MAG: hypothetical protein D6761_09080 [Candidatus Dadabacteria bacterium]